MFIAYAAFLVVLITCNEARNCGSVGVWTWQCQNDKCVKVISGSASGTELSTCKLTCGKYSSLFPKPSGHVDIDNSTVPFLPTSVLLHALTCTHGSCCPMVQWLIDQAFYQLQEDLQTVYAKHSRTNRNCNYCQCFQKAAERKVLIDVSIASDVTKLTLETDEGYSLAVTSNSSVVAVQITANTFFGARHGLETLGQLTAYMESHNSMQIVSSAVIAGDKPAYPYRGILLDTSRNFFSTKSILRLITAMSYNKLNTLHWHITDTHSFPIEIQSQPELSEYGAYSDAQIYTHNDVRSIVSHGLKHGVRVLPEFDEPAHCGEGWQFGPKANLGNLAVCVDQEPWRSYCSEPPCGQLNPTNDNVYEVLKKIYKEYIDLFDPDMFHAGGDEVNFNCWNTSKEITDWLKKNYGGVEEKDFMDMWGMFLQKSTAKLSELSVGRNLSLVLWTSKMTNEQYLTKYLDPKKHIIQIWETTTDNHITNVVKSGFKTIFSTYDTLYLDCGYGNWLVEGNNWCSPYKDWKLLYDNDPIRILKNFKVTVTEDIRKSILGQEAAMWSEQVDEATSEGKIWPRSAALAERLWSNPDHDWRGAEYRFVHHRGRMVERGVRADAVQPLWCHQNTGHCY